MSAALGKLASNYSDEKPLLDDGRHVLHPGALLRPESLSPSQYYGCLLVDSAFVDVQPDFEALLWIHQE